MRNWPTPFDHTASADSSLRRIQRFIASFAMDGDLVARLVFALLPERERLVLTINRNNFKVWRPSENRETKAFHLFSGLRIGQYRHYDKIVSINGQLCYLSGCRLQKGDFLIIVSFNRPQEAQSDYAERWQIEMCFKAMKSSGFDIEATHLTDLARLEKLVLLVMVAFVWCYRVGIYLHKIRIKVKKHGRKAKSIFRYGLDYISNYLLNAMRPVEIDISKFLSCT